MQNNHTLLGQKTRRLKRLKTSRVVVNNGRRGGTSVLLQLGSILNGIDCFRHSFRPLTVNVLSLRHEIVKYDNKQNCKL